MPNFEVYKDKKGLYNWRLISENGNIISESKKAREDRNQIISDINNVIMNRLDSTSKCNT